MARTLPLLDAPQRREFDYPPKFTAPQRSVFFSLPEWAEPLLRTMNMPHMRGGFLLQLGYFKASGRFFSAERFAAADRAYVQHRYALGEVDWLRYKRLDAAGTEPYCSTILASLPLKKSSRRCCSRSPISPGSR